MKKPANVFDRLLEQSTKKATQKKYLVYKENRVYVFEDSSQNNLTSTQPIFDLNKKESFGRMNSLTKEDIENVSAFPKANIYPKFHGYDGNRIFRPYTANENRLLKPQLYCDAKEIRNIRLMRIQLKRMQKKIQMHDVPKEGSNIVNFLPPTQLL